MTIITLTTDFGIKDGNVGVMKGVIWGFAPVAAHLGKVGILTELGVPIHDPVRIEFTHPEKTDSG